MTHPSRRWTRTGALITAVATVAGLTVPAQAAPDSCGFALASGTQARGPYGQEGSYGWEMADLTSVSPTGRYVVFGSQASYLDPLDRNGVGDVFIKDLDTGTVRTGSLGSNDKRTTSESGAGLLSSNGRFLVFYSLSKNLHASANGWEQIYIRDLVANTTRLVSITPSGYAGNGPSYPRAVSGDGRYVVFMSSATNLRGSASAASDPDSATRQLYLRDRTSGKTSLVSVSSTEKKGNRTSHYAGISDDGRWITFASDATNLVSGDGNGATDVFIRDRANGTTRLVSITRSGGSTGSGMRSTYPKITRNGRFVLFTSRSGGLVSGDSNTRDDVFIRDLSNRTTRRVSLGNSGVQSDNHSRGWGISDDGNRVTFMSSANNFDKRARRVWDAYARDLITGKTRLYTVCDDGTIPQPTVGYSSEPVLVSGDGRRVFVQTQGWTMAPEYTELDQVFYRSFVDRSVSVISTDGPWLSDAAFAAKARLTRSSGSALASKTVSFRLLKSDRSFISGASSVTDASGDTLAQIITPVPEGWYLLETSFEGDAGWMPSRTLDWVQVDHP